MFVQTLPVLINKEQEKKDKKKNGCPEKKRPSTPYILWCKDQWNEVYNRKTFGIINRILCFFNLILMH